MIRVDEITYQRHFYPRSPYGERPSDFKNAKPAKHFYPRSPYGERLHEIRNALAGFSISIHALLTESDVIIGWNYLVERISIHALLTESDSERWQKLDVCIIFLSTLSLRRATYQ